MAIAEAQTSTAGARRLGPTPARLGTGDPLRALAALGVLLLHVAAYAGDVITRPSANPAADAMERFGLLGHLMVGAGNGLQVFFVLSGFLLSRPFVAAWWLGRPRPSVRRYARHRLLRIVPAFYALVLLVALVFGSAGSSLGQRLEVPVFAQGLDSRNPFIAPMGHGWSLGAEMLFYVVLGGAALLLLLRRRERPVGPVRGGRALVLALGALVLVFVALTALRQTATDGRPLAFFHPWNALASFVPGVGLAVLEQALRGRAWSAVTRRVAVVLAVGGAALAISTPSLPWSSGLSAYLVPVSGATLVLAGLILAEQCGPPWRLLDNRLLHWVGARSYGIYLAHYPICIYFIFHMDQERWWRALAIMLPVTLVGSVVVADLMHRFVERPALAFRDGWPGRAPVAPVEAGAA